MLLYLEIILKKKKTNTSQNNNSNNPDLNHVPSKYKGLPLPKVPTTLKRRGGIKRKKEKPSQSNV